MNGLYIILLLLTLIVLSILLWPIRRERQITIIIGIFFCVAASVLYIQVGAPDVAVQVATREARIKAAAESITQHSERVKKDPHDLAAWVALGQGFAEAEQWKAASGAFKRAVVLSGGDARLIMAYAKSLIFADGGTVGAQAKKSLEMVLLIEPENPEARYYLAVHKLQNGQTEDAMRDMKALYRSLPDDSPLKAMINRQIGR